MNAYQCTLFLSRISLDTYLSFLKHLNETGQIEEANKVLWRASKAVADNDAFAQRHSEMLEGRWTEPSFGIIELDVDMDVDMAS